MAWQRFYLLWCHFLPPVNYSPLLPAIFWRSLFMYVHSCIIFCDMLDSRHSTIICTVLSAVCPVRSLLLFDVVVFTLLFFLTATRVKRTWVCVWLMFCDIKSVQSPYHHISLPDDEHNFLACMYIPIILCFLPCLLLQSFYFLCCSNRILHTWRRLLNNTYTRDNNVYMVPYVCRVLLGLVVLIFFSLSPKLKNTTHTSCYYTPSHIVRLIFFLLCLLCTMYVNIVVCSTPFLLMLLLAGACVKGTGVRVL